MSISRKYCQQSVDEYLEYVSTVKESFSEERMRSILASYGFSVYPRPRSLYGNWSSSFSKTVPAIKYDNLDMTDIRECVTVMPHQLYGYGPHVLHYTSGTNSLVSSEEIEFFIWFNKYYGKLSEIQREIGNKTGDKKGYVGEKLHELFKGEELTMYQISFLNTYFGNPSIFNQLMADIGLCFECFRPGIPRSGLGITRTHQKVHYAIIHEQAKPWSKHSEQHRDYVRVNNSGQYLILDEMTGKVSFVTDKRDPKGHISYNLYDSENFLIGKPRCICKKRS